MTDQTDNTAVPTGPNPSEPIEVPEFITETQADRVFRYLDGVSVRIEKDPTVMGPSYVHEKLKECRDFSIEVENLLVTYFDIERKVKNLLAGQKEVIKASRAELLAMNPWVDKGRSAADREARADMNLKGEIDAMIDLKEQAVNVSYVLRAIELKREGLNRTNNDIKKQVSLMEFARGTNYNLGTDNEYNSYDGLIEGTTTPSKGTPMDSSDDDVMQLFGEDLPVIEEAPAEIHPEQAKHIGEHDSTDIDPMEDMDDFLSNLQVDDVEMPVDVEDDDEEVDFSALLNGAVNPPPKKAAPAPKYALEDDSDVVDIGDFLANS